MQLLEQVNVGGLTLRNRVLRSATLEHMGTLDGAVTPLMEKVYEELAANEVGVIVSCAVYVAEGGKLAKDQSGLEQDDRIPGWKAITDKVHANGGKILAQIHHGGARAVVSPVNIAEISAEEIVALEDAFAAAAVRAKAAGFDGVQIHCAHRYLLASSLSEEENTRTDEYGGSVENRCRMVKEIAEKIKAACGPEYPIWVKLDSNLYSTKETPRGDLAEIGKELEACGIALIEVSGANQSEMKDDVHLYYLEGAKILKEATNVPICLTGGVRDLDEVAEVLEAGIELIGLSRPLICEPDLVLQWKNGDRTDCKCISCGICRSLFGRRGKRCAFHGKKYEEM